MRRSIGIARLSVAFSSLLLLSNAAGAQLAVSANDGHTAFVNNTTVGSDNPVPDTITVLDLRDRQGIGESGRRVGFSAVERSRSVLG